MVINIKIMIINYITYFVSYYGRRIIFVFVLVTVFWIDWEQFFRSVRKRSMTDIMQ